MLRSFIFNPTLNASKHACASAAKAEPTFSWMVALEAIILPPPSLATTPEPALRRSLLHLALKLIFISFPDGEVHVSLIVALTQRQTQITCSWGFEQLPKAQGSEGRNVMYFRLLSHIVDTLCLLLVS